MGCGGLAITSVASYSACFYDCHPIPAHDTHTHTHTHWRHCSPKFLFAAIREISFMQVGRATISLKLDKPFSDFSMARCDSAGEEIIRYAGGEKGKRVRLRGARGCFLLKCIDLTFCTPGTFGRTHRSVCVCVCVCVCR